MPSSLPSHSAAVLRLYHYILDCCSRPTSHTPLIRELDGLRLIAILGVIGTHLVTFLGKHTNEQFGAMVREDPVCRVLSSGFIGVQLFFAISGFILALPFARSYLTGSRQPKLKQYYFRRLSRIEPPYIINILVFFLILVIARGMSITELAPHLFTSCLYVHNIVYDTPSLINGVAWSLEVEVQFYCLAPFIAGIFAIGDKRTRRAVLVGVMAASGALVQSLSETHEHGLHLLSEINFFLVGFLLADVYVADWRETPPKPELAYDCVAVAALLGLSGVASAVGSHRLLVPPLLLVIGVCAFRGRLFGHVLRHPVVYTLGGMCYSTYLYHYWVLTVVGWAALRFLPMPHSPPVLAALLLTIMVPPIFVVSGFAFVLLEKPFMKREWASAAWDGILRLSGANHSGKPRLDEAKLFNRTNIVQADSEFSKCPTPDRADDRPRSTALMVE